MGWGLRRVNRQGAGQAFGFGADAFKHGAVGGPRVVSFISALVGDGFDTQRKIRWRAAQRVAFLEQGGEGGGVGACYQQHMRQTGMQRQGGEAATVGGDAALV